MIHKYRFPIPDSRFPIPDSLYYSRYFNNYRPKILLQILPID
ncbi:MULTISPECIES: hypothetical protein [Moorena]|nr:MULTISPECIES: hypothetical protein [Moorena]